MLTRTYCPNASLSAFLTPGCTILTRSLVHFFPMFLIFSCAVCDSRGEKHIYSVHFFLSLSPHQMDKHKGTRSVAQHNTHATLCGLCRGHPRTVSKFSQPVRSILTSEVEKKKEKVKKQNKKKAHASCIHVCGWIYGECGTRECCLWCIPALGRHFILFYLTLPGESSKLVLGMPWMVWALHVRVFAALPCFWVLLRYQCKDVHFGGSRLSHYGTCTLNALPMLFFSALRVMREACLSRECQKGFGTVHGASLSRLGVKHVACPQAWPPCLICTDL